MCRPEIWEDIHNMIKESSAVSVFNVKLPSCTSRRSPARKIDFHYLDEIGEVILLSNLGGNCSD